MAKILLDEWASKHKPNGSTENRRKALYVEGFLIRKCLDIKNDLFSVDNFIEIDIVLDITQEQFIRHF